MTDASLVILIWTAVSIAFIHTVIGPDHYLPFIVISKARTWSIPKTLIITIACGIGHVLSSIIIGVIGIAVGSALGDLTALEKTRGDIASYALIAFGTIYAIWGLWRAGNGHGHRHLPGGKHVDETDTKTMTFWALFIVFVLGPCEPLIPLVMFPAVGHNWHGVALVALSFGLVTIVTMSTIVFLSVKGLALFRTTLLEKYIHALAGGIIAVSGLSIKLFGL